MRRLIDKVYTIGRGMKMRSEKFKEFKEEGHHRGGRHRGRDGSHQRGAKTFRREDPLLF